MWYIYTYNGILFSFKKKEIIALQQNDGPKVFYTRRNKPERQISYDITYMGNLKKKLMQMNLNKKTEVYPQT